MIEGYIAKVIEHIEAEDCVRVLFLGASTLEVKVKVLHKRANPLYGVAGDLPDIGEQGIVFRLGNYGQEYFWIGSYHSLTENICTTEANKRIDHHDSGVWSKLDKDGNIEFSHPSGTYLKIGSNTVLSQRTRYKKKVNTNNLKESVNYDLCQQQPVNIFLKHIWALSALTEGECINDNRQKAYSGATKSTTIQISSAGVITITHETSGGTNVVLQIDSAGNVFLSTPEKVTINADNDVTVQSDTNIKIDAGGDVEVVAVGDAKVNAANIIATAATLAQLIGTSIQLGAASGFKPLATDAIIAIFNSHTHPGDSGGTTGSPNSTLSSSEMTSETKAT